MARLQAIYHIRCDATIDRRARAGDRRRAERRDAACRRSTTSMCCRRSSDASRASARSAPDCSKRGSRCRRRRSAATPGSSSTCCSATPRSTTTSCCTTPRSRTSLRRCSAARGTGSTACGGASAPARRALTCSAIKPQGLPPAKLAAIARRFADGGIDYIKDDHGLADQAYSPFKDRVAAIAAALRGTARALRAEHHRRSRRHARADRRRARRRHRHRDGRADGRRASRTSTAWSPTIPTWPSSRIPRSRARRALRRRSTSAGCSGCWAPTPSCSPITAGGSAIRRTPAGRLPQRALEAAQRPAPLRAGSGRRHEPRARGRDA